MNNTRPSAVAQDAVVTKPRQSKLLLVWNRFKDNKIAIVSFIVVLAAILVAIAMPYLGFADPRSFSSDQYSPPGQEYLMGTDNFGRDILSRTLWGTRLGLMVAAGAAGISSVLGIVLGAIPGYFGGWLDDVMSRIFDVFLLVPVFFLVVLVVALFGSNIYYIIIIIGIATWPRSARVMRSQVLSLKNRTFVQAALASGANHWQALFIHVIPNGLTPVITNSTILMGFAILTEAGLSFLGLGDPNTVSWGRMIFDGQRHLMIAPWMSIFPGLMMLLLVCAFNLLGDGLNYALDPRLRELVEQGSGRAAILRSKAAVVHAAPSPPVQVESEAPPIIEVNDLRMYYRLGDKDIRAVDGVSFMLPRSGSLGIVGESGCGKSSLGMALMRALPGNARIVSGKLVFDGEEVSALNDAQFRSIRWKRMAMVFQSAMNALNPVFRISDQIADAYRLHRPKASYAEAMERARELFSLVGIPVSRLKSYPHELSGGMRQRVIIVMSLLLDPDVIIADEPTTALDVLVQDQILAEIDRLRSELGLGLILITHDMGVVAETCQRVAVMYAGHLVEEGPAGSLFEQARHPYTRGLLAALPTLRGPRIRLRSLAGEPASLIDPPQGCRYRPRCPIAADICMTAPEPTVVASGHMSRCHFALEPNRFEALSQGGL